MKAPEYGAFLLGEAVVAIRDRNGRGEPKRAAKRLGFHVFRSGDNDRDIPVCPHGGVVANPFGDGVDYERCGHCGTYWPVNATRRPIEWCHDSVERDAIRDAIRALADASNVEPRAVDKALEWADRYYLVEHLRPGCNACQ